MQDEIMQTIIRAMTGLQPNQSPTPEVAARAMQMPNAGMGRYGQGYSPNPAQPVPTDRPPRVTPEAADMLFRLHESVAAESPELGAVLWKKIQAFTGDF